MELFKVDKLSEEMYRIHGVTDEQMYLIIGEEKALLVDTGCGVGDLRKVVEELTDKEVIVVLTHGHLDHAMGAGSFDTVYINNNDEAIFKEHESIEFLREYFNLSGIKWELVQQEIKQRPDFNAFLQVTEGDTFDLGAIHINVYMCPGHTRGSICLLVREKRILITGDACNPFTFLFFEDCPSVEEYETNLMCLEEKSRKLFDKVVFSHGDVVGSGDLIKDVIQVCRDIKFGSVSNQKFDFMGEKALIAKSVNSQLHREEGGVGNIVYNPKNIWKS